jgi:ribosomal protein L16 Arg81 hydroxylase
MYTINNIEELFYPSEHHKFYKDDSFEKITWDEVITNIDVTVCQETRPPLKILDNLGIVSHDTTDMLKTYPIRDLIKKYRSNIDFTVHLYVSLTSVSNTFGKHNDFTDVIIWQCLGITRWTIYDKQTVQYDLKPGEFLYIPRNMFHDTIPITPRASISFGLYPES